MVCKRLLILFFVVVIVGLPMVGFSFQNEEVNLINELPIKMPVIEHIDAEQHINVKAGGIKQYPVAEDGKGFYWNGVYTPLPNDELLVKDDFQLFANGGPYRRVLSNKGYRAVTGYVHLPKTDEIGDLRVEDGETKDIPYIYFGGSGTKESDVGLIYSYAQKKWFPYFKLAGEDPWVGNVSFSPGQTLFMQFYISPHTNNRVHLYVGGYLYSFNTGTGYPIDGNNVRMKRVVSIAMTNEGIKDKGFIKNAGFSDINIFKYEQPGQLWTAGYTSTRTTYPNGTVVQVTGTKQDYEETISIDISKW